jgi:cell division protein ZapE
MTIREAYKAAAQAQSLVADPAQERVVRVLDELQSRILAAEKPRARLRRLFRSREKYPGPRGVYLWGGVGRGKTFLMDLFFESLAIRNKRRSHFHRMMSEVHSRLKLVDNVEDPLDRVAGDIANETSVLCFDEFFVSDIGDAMILGRLLDSLFRRGVVLVATSNAHPRDLYRDGLQRQRFMPAIEAIEACMEITELAGAEDYRLRLFEQAGTWFAPHDAAVEIKLSHYFGEIASGEIRQDATIEVLGRDIRTKCCAKGVAWFDFRELCDGPRSQEDYIEIARWYPTVIVSNVPLLDREHEDQARRFIAMVDEFYDRRVKMVASAAAGIEELYTGRRLGFEFQRTSSRLTEMQTEQYLHSPHLP